MQIISSEVVSILKWMMLHVGRIERTRKGNLWFSPTCIFFRKMMIKHYMNYLNQKSRIYCTWGKYLKLYFEDLSITWKNIQRELVLNMYWAGFSIHSSRLQALIYLMNEVHVFEIFVQNFMLPPTKISFSFCNYWGRTFHQ